MRNYREIIQIYIYKTNFAYISYKKNFLKKS